MIEDDLKSLKVIAEQMLKQKQRDFDSIVIANHVLKDSNTAKAKYYIEEFVNIGVVEPIYKKIGDKSLRAIRYSYKLEVFLKEGGFESVLEKLQQDKINTDEFDALRKRNLELENEAHEFEKTIRNQNQKIRDLTQTNLRWELIQKYWWAFGIAIGLGILIGKLIA